MATNVILLARQGMNVATWNVNGIRARASQVREWLGRERPDVVCLQELKAEPAQIPEECRLAEYHAYWHGRKGYSGVSLLIRKELLAGDPLYSHPPFDVESRIVQVELGRLVIASVYVPNGGKDYPAKLNFLTALTHRGGPRQRLRGRGGRRHERPCAGGDDDGVRPGCALARYTTRPIGNRAIPTWVDHRRQASRHPGRTRQAGRRGAQHHKPTHRA